MKTKAQDPRHHNRETPKLITNKILPREIIYEDAVRLCYILVKDEMDVVRELVDQVTSDYFYDGINN